MATTIDYYNSKTFQQTDPFGGELMEALLPFIKSPSTDSPASAFSFASYPDVCLTQPIPYVSSDLNQTHSYSNLLSPKPVPMKQTGEFGEYQPLQSPVDDKLEAICKSLAETQKPTKKSSSRRRSSTAKQPEEVKSEDYSSVVSPPSTENYGSPLSDLTFVDVEEEQQPWNVNFALDKYPSYEIDWDSILST
ncbi:hypothetical protein YC2023_058566 [Brassica napus]